MWRTTAVSFTKHTLRGFLRHEKKASIGRLFCLVAGGLEGTGYALWLEGTRFELYLES